MAPEDGQFDVDYYESIKDLSVQMHEYAYNSGYAAKGSLQRHRRALKQLQNVARALSVI